jgi:arylsulfatase A-like enzyme
LFSSCTTETNTDNNLKPNIVFILADDLGYGDVSCYNPESKVPTPNLDRIAKEGLLFTDAHSPSTVCTPSRYGILTGRMAFRNGQKGVFTGVGGPCLIEEGRLTLPQMMKNHGYKTIMNGKWHVGMTFYDSIGSTINQNGFEAVKRVDFSRKIPDSPIHRGFDKFFGTVCCPTTDFLYAFVDGDSIPNPPTRILDRTKLPYHPYGNDCRVGLIAPDFDHEEVDMLFLEKSLSFLNKHSEEDPNKPFFLFHSTQAVHLPSFAGKEFKGKTNAGPHGDFIFEFDFIVGEIIKGLIKNGFGENTIVLISSDNGPEVPTVKAMRRDYQHDGARPWRGVKRDNWEGGHRVPMIAWWPSVIKSGTKNDATICLTDLMATFADILNVELPNNAGEDSFSFLPILLGEKEDIREYTLHQTITLDLAIRKGNWKFLDHKGSAGSNYDNDSEWGMKEYVLPELAPNAPGQLYDLSNDPGETTNLYFKYPKIVNKLKTQLTNFVENNRSTAL